MVFIHLLLLPGGGGERGRGGGWPAHGDHAPQLSGGDVGGGARRGSSSKTTGTASTFVCIPHLSSNN